LGCRKLALHRKLLLNTTGQLGGCKLTLDGQLLFRSGKLDGFMLLNRGAGHEFGLRELCRNLGTGRHGGLLLELVGDTIAMVSKLSRGFALRAGAGPLFGDLAANLGAVAHKTSIILVIAKVV
jgi:hypothetical protein